MTTPTQTARAPIGAAEFRDAMAHLAAPLTIITTTDGTGRRWGFTASAVTSVSMEPPLLLVGIARTSSCHPALTSAPEFVVNLLGAEHAATARTFARSGVDRFAAGGFEPWPGSDLPLLTNAHAAFLCRRADVLPAGDHDLLLGELLETRSGPGDEPLLWHQREFRTPAGRPAQ
ncbi:flavin reductase family protein [Streptomyces roseifaciens]|uniref:flavin reductase family protein n=1 Tax=Streptomyces roseifaciens TaxID=1488406 RepID=UPI000B0190A4|nr:flavin reductase family protein [Streptomyces roseifaciens]